MVERNFKAQNVLKLENYALQTDRWTRYKHTEELWEAIIHQQYIALNSIGQLFRKLPTATNSKLVN